MKQSTADEKAADVSIRQRTAIFMSRRQAGSANFASYWPQNCRAIAEKLEIFSAIVKAGKDKIAECHAMTVN